MFPPTPSTLTWNHFGCSGTPAALVRKEYGQPMNEMQFDFDGLIELLAKHLYSEKKVFIRELIQNAHDGIRRRGRSGRIDVETRPQKLEISIRDDGIGMDRDDLIDYLANIGRSLTRASRDATEGLIGQFGIGFLSAFVVARRVQVRTRKEGDETGWLWENDGSKEYRLAEDDVADVGTEVTVYLREPEDRGIIQESEVRAVIRKYADMLTVPIHLNGANDPENTMHMPWERAGLSPDELQYDSRLYLLRTVTEPVLEAIPIRITQPVRVDGVLYISRYRLIGVDQPRTVRVFQNRMFLCDNAADILPNWARFVNGIINTSDLTPTAARDNFLRDEAAERVQQALGKAIIEHLETLRRDDPARFLDIARFHRLGFAAACYYYDDFFKRFADLLTWRTNRGGWSTTAGRTEPNVVGRESEMFSPAQDLAGQEHTLPEILDRLGQAHEGTTRLPCFTTASTASQYFQIADADGSVVIDASYVFEAELLEAYTRLPGKNIQLVHVDREDDPAVFKRLRDDDAAVAALARTMSQTLRTPFGATIRTEARHFRPGDIAAVIRSDARTAAQQKADEVRLDPNSSAEMRELAEELARMTATASRRLTINAANPLVRRIAAQDQADPAVQSLMMALYNNAVLANQEMITATDATIFSRQFQELMGRSLDYLEMQGQLQEARRLLREEEDLRRRSAPGNRPEHRIFFMITPFAERYRPVVDSCRQVVEEEWGCQLVVANDRYDDPHLLPNVELLMRQSDAFIAEITEANPNVMFELGLAYGDQQNRPFVLLRQQRSEPLVADLRSLLYIDYAADNPDLSVSLAAEMRKHSQIRALLDADDRAEYISPKRLKRILRMDLPSVTFERLADRYPTLVDWRSADVLSVSEILGREDEDFADPILKRVLREHR